MKIRSSHILISLCMLGILLAPVTPVLQIQNTADIKIAVNINTAHAENSDLFNAFEGCGLGIFSSSSITGCFLTILYWLTVAIPAWLMSVSAKIFDFAAAITLSDTMYRASFIEKIWHIVRDFANIFFILILLYAAFTIIMGGSSGKKMVASVLLIALVVNFSLFFTRVVVDSSNVLGLIFYNKIQQDPKAAGFQPTSDATKTGVQEKEVADRLVANYDINKLFNKDFLSKLEPKDYQTNGPGVLKSIYGVVATFSTLGMNLIFHNPLEEDKTISPGTAAGLMVIYCILALSLAWAFFTVGISFIGRLIMLMILMIVSPIAFVSFAVPKFRSVDTIGFDSWLKKLLETSFVAAIFMAILYVITEVVNADLFTNFSNESNSLPTVQRILLVVIPVMVVVIFLKKGASYAKKASGEVTTQIMSIGKKVGMVAGGAGLMLAAGGGAAIGKRVIGGGGGYLANKLASGADKMGLKGVGTKLRDFSDYARKSSFDIRGAKIMGKTLGSVTGMKVGEAQKGGWTEMKKKQVEKRQKRAEQLEKRGTGKEKADVDEAETAIKDAVMQDSKYKDKDGIIMPVKLVIENCDKDIDKARKDLKDALDTGDTTKAALATSALNDAKVQKDNIRKDAGLPELERKRDRAKTKLDVKSNEITRTYAENIKSTGNKLARSIVTLGGYSWDGADEASRKIRTGNKMDKTETGEKPH